MSYPVFTKQEFMTGLDRLGEDDARKLLRGGALDGEEARWAIEWLARGPVAIQPPAAREIPVANQGQQAAFALAS